MEKVIFLYSILLITVCAFSISPAGILYTRTKKPVYLYLTLLFVCFLIELTELHYIAFLGIPSGQVRTEDLNHISYPALRITISLIILLLDLLILLWITRRRWRFAYLLLLLPYLCICTYLTTLPQTELVVWLFYSIRQFYRIGYCAYFSLCLFMEKEPETSAELQKYALPIFGIFLLNLCIMLEDSLIISHIDFFLSDIPFISERNFSENFLWMFICIYAMFICISKISGSSSEQKEPTGTTVQTNKDSFIPDEGFHAFIDHYKLTPRETEILKCMAEHKSTAEICEELCISTGTVKTHIHNIYAKVDVNTKSELIKKLISFSDL